MIGIIELYPEVLMLGFVGYITMVEAYRKLMGIPVWRFENGRWVLS